MTGHVLRVAGLVLRVPLWQGLICSSLVALSRACGTLSVLLASIFDMDCLMHAVKNVAVLENAACKACCVVVSAWACSLLGDQLRVVLFAIVIGSWHCHWQLDIVW
jgi:hypothetical protein